LADLVRVDGPHGGVATITLNRPEKRNALSIAVRDAVSDALDRLAADEDCKVVVVTGTGAVFSAGFDLREFEQLGVPLRPGAGLQIRSQAADHVCLGVLAEPREY